MSPPCPAGGSRGSSQNNKRALKINSDSKTREQNNVLTHECVFSLTFICKITTVLFEVENLFLMPPVLTQWNPEQS